jgi:hypothetical protein
MCNTDYDHPDIYNEKLLIARKDHKCSECSRVILKGEQYKKVDGLWQKRWETYKTCAHCLVLQDWLIAQCGGFLHQGLKDEIGEHAYDYGSMVLARGLISMRRKWKKFKSDGLMPVLKPIDVIVPF